VSLYTCCGNPAPSEYTPLPPGVPTERSPTSGAATKSAAVKKYWSPGSWPCGAKYDATYIVLAVTATGDENVTFCQPLAVSLENVADARRVPELDHRLPTWVPPLPVPL
jgi:hypothetical protein